MATRQLADRRIDRAFGRALCAKDTRVDAGTDLPDTPEAPAHHYNPRAFLIKNGTSRVAFANVYHRQAHRQRA
jgi:hypothetical protein